MKQARVRCTPSKYLKDQKGILKEDETMKYKVGDKVRNIVSLENDSNEEIPAGTVMRIVAISEKVRLVKTDSYHDNSPYFFNAVVDSQENDYEKRIRANFCTIEKVN